MKRFTLVLLLLVTFSPVWGQPIDSRLENHDALEKEAIQLTKIYDRELAFTAEQYILFQKKVEAFLVKAAAVKETHEGKKRLELLYRLQEEEIAEMDDILTRIQWKRYVEIRPDIQPLDRVKT